MIFGPESVIEIYSGGEHRERNGGVDDRNLEVAISVFLFEYYTYSLFHVDEEAAGPSAVGGLLVFEKESKRH